MTIQGSTSGPSDTDTVSLRPILLHSGYRSGSTWFWGRFRHCAGAYCYSEPLNVKLAALTPEEIAADRPDAWPSGHPTDMRPYTEEYRPLLAPGGGVLLYEARFGVETYYNLGADPALENYLEMLTLHARRQAKLPVLGFCCSLGKVEWFRRFVDGINIVTWRNPRDQWMSCHRQWTEHGNFSFEVHALLAAYIGRLTPSVATLFAGLGPLPAPDEIAPTMPLFAEPSRVETRFRIFLRVFTLDTLLSIQQADLTVDLDLLSQSAGHRAGMTDKLRAITGLGQLSFGDCRLPRHEFADDADYAAALRGELDFLEAFALTPEAKTFSRSLPFLRGKLLALIADEK